MAVLTDLQRCIAFRDEPAAGHTYKFSKLIKFVVFSHDVVIMSEAFVIHGLWIKLVILALLCVAFPLFAVCLVLRIKFKMQKICFVVILFIRFKYFFEKLCVQKNLINFVIIILI